MPGAHGGIMSCFFPGMQGRPGFDSFTFDTFIIKKWGILNW